MKFSRPVLLSTLSSLTLALGGAPGGAQAQTLLPLDSRPTTRVLPA
ncbi:hypothetical protein IHN32_18620, partial [Deinococcus sp. 14RED07]|nr:hypothetical protein [Deinococcus sp. 14RED07]